MVLLSRVPKSDIIPTDLHIPGAKAKLFMANGSWQQNLE